jgi:hypothetical protein
MRFLSLFVCLSAFVAAGCSSEEQVQQGDPDASTGDASSETEPVDSATDAASDSSIDAPVDAPADMLSVERWGDRLYGTVHAVRRVGRSLFVGTNGIVDPDVAGKVRAGLLRLDLDTGAVRVFESELPAYTFTDFGPLKDLTGPVSTGSAIEDGARTLVIAQSGVLVLEGDKLALHAIEVGAAKVIPREIAVDRSGGRKRLWVSTDRGLVRLDPDTFTVDKVYAATELGGADVGPLALDPATGAVYAGVQVSADATKLLRVDGDTVTTATTTGRVASIVFSKKLSAAFVALQTYDMTTGGVVKWDGTTMTTIAVEGQLAFAARTRYTSFGTAELAIDDDDGLLIVGGQPRKQLSSLEGGGLAWINLADGTMMGISQEAGNPTPGDFVASLAYDSKTKRTYAALKQPCSDRKMANVGLVSFYFDEGGGLHVERPVLSGVRALATMSGATYVALRDDVPGNACDGNYIQTGLVKLLDNHAGETAMLFATRNEVGDPPPEYHAERAGGTVLSVRDATHIAFGVPRDDLYVGAPIGGMTFNPAITAGVSLFQLDLAWADDKTLFIGSRAQHEPDGASDTSPRGGAKIELGGDGSFVKATHFVRDSMIDTDIKGLPSSEVTAVVPLADGSAYFVCATERVRAPGRDRDEGTPFLDGTTPRLGGLAKVSATGTITVLVSGAELPDPRAAALDDKGNLLLVDSTKGLLRWTGSKLEAVPSPVTIPSGAIPHGMLTTPDATATTWSLGAHVTIGKTSAFVGDVGHAWRAMAPKAGVVLVGTDRGLLRVRGQGVTDSKEATPGVGHLPQTALVNPPPAPGACIALHAPCGANPTGCCAGTTCSSLGIIQTCE